MKSRIPLLSLFLIVFLISHAQEQQDYILLKKYITEKPQIEKHKFYIVKINTASPQAVRNRMALNAYRQLSGALYIMDSVGLVNAGNAKDLVQIAAANNIWKLSPAVEAISSVKDKIFNFQVLVTDAVFGDSMIQLPALKEKNARLIPGQNIISIMCTYKDIENIFLPQHKVIFIDILTEKPKVELGTPGYDLSANKINVVHDLYPTISGLGQHVSIKEDYYDTTDIDIKGRIEPSPVASSKITNHANFMATIIAGAGNSANYATGVAWAALISSSSFEQVLPDADNYYSGKNITVQNHSYGTVIDNNYSLSAQAFDKSANNNPALVHVFSSGNSGTSVSTSGTYNGIANYANLTGNFKMAKNIFTVGAVDSLGNVAPLSSSGPAYDGRIKPEIVAFQKNGTSEAAALVSGTALLMQQYYKALHNTELPSALAKAILINTATDINNTGPDYKTGFGNMDAIKAMDLIKANTIFSGTITQAATQTFLLNIPSNIALAKLTLVWNDTASTPSAPVALINDLDLELVMPANNQHWKPWVLSSFPNIDSLNSPARRNRDSLNNVEQVTLENPLPGNYQVTINGHNVPTGSQKYYVAYSLDTAGIFHWQRPVKNDFAEAGTKTILRWENTFSGTGSIEYSLSGNNWLPVNANVDLTGKYFYWNVPDTIAPAVLRMKIGSTYFYSDTFSITTLLKPTTGFICGDSVLVYWHKLKNIQQYEVYQLGEKYMQPLSLVADTSIIIAKSNLIDKYIAVAPVFPNGSIAQKSYAFDYMKQGAGCFINSFYAVANGNQATLNLSLGTLLNVAAIVFEKKDILGFSTVASPAITSSQDYIVNYSPLKSGITSFRVKIILTTGQIIYTNVESVFYAAPGEYIVLPIPANRGTGLTLYSAAPDGEILSLIDPMGRIVLQKQIVYTRELILTASLPAGQYFYRVTKKGIRLASGKLIIL